jgi:uncharacterized membrane protein YqiK
VIAVLAAVVVLGLVLIALLGLRVRKLRRQYAIIRGDGQETDVVGAVTRSLKSVAAMDQRVNEIAAALRQQIAASRSAVQRFALVRYDAFDDMGGQLSFSTALLDDHGDGIVLTSINGRSETRTYAKPVKGLNSSHNLSDEERRAIAEAAGAPRESAREPAASRSL